MNLGAYFLEEPHLAKAVKEFFDKELSIQLKGKIDQPLVTISIIGKEFRFLDQIESLYFCGGISDHTFRKGEEKSWEDLVNKAKYSALLVFAIELRCDNPTRTILSEITRKLNRVSSGAPVVVLFRYHECLSLATCERMTKKKGDGEKLGKVSLLKDVDLKSPHAGHLRILQELRVARTGRNSIHTFNQLYSQWLSVFNLKVLNEKFYRELFHWYLWAIRLVRIPPKPKDEPLDEESLKSIFVIRLITRLIFVWFVKEKRLISETLFDPAEITKYLKDFDPASNSTSKYYRAILQNLFFATLNTPLPAEAKDESEKRRFIDLNRKGRMGYTDDYANQTLYRYEEYFLDSTQALKLFNSIPFLNGGLFECLDFPENKVTGEPERRYDGFSSVKEKQAFVPEVLFFGGDTQLDITKDLELDEKRGRRAHRLVKVRGIIHTLNDYKFTIAENTPLDEEVALDPELLGKAFENLLASYNPETRATARKLTGSFYTPREIVSYMVDESLKAYLLQCLLSGTKAFVEFGRKQTQMFGNEGRKGQTSLIQEVGIEENKRLDFTAKLEKLFDYADMTNPFDEVDTDRLIRAISDCKILDPACGSGAFPMGILHRMVNLLSKLDPKNIKWKHELLRKAEEDLSVARKMNDDVIREKAVESAQIRIEYIKESFANNRHELDYTRKLFLIEHCIYGVDIQQIAVQIAKLRFFISLMVDQQLDDTKPNRNMLSMPNLETKFVAANSLISLDRNVGTRKGTVGVGIFRSPDVERLEEQLKELRKEIFYTRKYAAKKLLKVREEKLREDLKTALKASGYDERSAQQMADWNPFDPIHFAGFFDPEIMFGLKHGFDIVIGNPPYFQIQKLDESSKRELERQGFETYARTGDLYCLFYERGVKLLTSGGWLCYITSNKWMRADYGVALREFFTKYTRPVSLIDFGMTLVFDSATTLTNVMLLTNVGRAKTVAMCRIGDDYTVDTPLNSYFKSRAADVQHPEGNSWVAYDKKEYKLIQKIECQGVPIENWRIVINYGIKTGLNDAYIVDESTKNLLIQEDRSSEGLLRPILRGEDIRAYVPRFNRQWIVFIPWHFPLHEDPNIAGPSKEAEKLFLEKFPAVYRHLESYKKQLSGRNKAETGIRYEWYALQRWGANYYRDFDKPKIIYPNMTNALPFAYDENTGYLCNDKAFIMTGEKLKYLVAILNSALFKFAFKERFPELLGDTREVRKVFFEKIPIKKPESDRTERVFEMLVNKILRKKNGNPDVDTSDIEREIDLKVYHLYELTFREVQMIDPSVTEEEWTRSGF